MATILPISSKSGIAILASAHMYAEEWSANLQIENDEYKHFEMTADANNLVWAQVLTSFSKGDATLAMKFDNTNGARPMPDKNIWLDKTGTGFLGFSSLVGLVIVYTILNVRPAISTGNSNGALWPFDIRITACTFTTTGP